MTIWDAYCDARWRAGFKRLLCAKGMPANEADEVMYMFEVYVTRIKGTIFASELVKIDNRDEFAKKLDDIFQNKWKGHMKDSYRVVPTYFKEYLDYLDAAQAARGVFFNDEEKARLDIKDPEFPQSELTKYETDFMRDGKLLSLQNPALLSMLRHMMEPGDVSLKSIPRYCKNYYMTTIPSMQPSDFRPLVNNIWGAGKKIRNGKRDSKFEINYPDGHTVTLIPKEALKEVILFYGFQQVKSKHLEIRSNDLATNTCPYGREKDYEEIPSVGFFYKGGNTTDKRNALNTINALFGRKLTIRLI